ncbi:MAG: VTT domain-containing protein [Bryobacteraceae bacterium]
MRSIIDLLQSWGPFGAMLLAVLDSAGIPLPAGVDALLTAVSITSPARAYLSAALAVIGSAIGCMFLFFLARKGGKPYLDRHASSRQAMKLRNWFARYGLLTVFIPAMVPIIPLPTKVFVLSAGALGIRPLAFLATVLAARVPRYFFLAYLGSQLGDNSLPWLKSHVWYLVAFSLGLLLFLFALIKLTERRTMAQ